MQETQVQYPDQGDTLEKWMATNSSIHTWRIPWTEEPGHLQSMRSQRIGHDWVTNIHTHTYICIYHFYFTNVLFTSFFNVFGNSQMKFSLIPSLHLFSKRVNKTKFTSLIRYWSFAMVNILRKTLSYRHFIRKLI